MSRNLLQMARPPIAAIVALGWICSAPVAAAPAARETAATGAKPFKKPSPSGTATRPLAGPPASAGPPAPTDVAPPYEPQLLRLAELLGALAYLQDLCGGHQGDVWRQKMAALLDAEAKTPVRKERLAGAFNRGFQGYALTYRQCTQNAQAVIDRFLDESGKIARDVARQYGPS
jgi:uncharacterized protein (TIGR02301 family)